MTAAPLAAVVCDLGGVLIDAPFDAFTALERASGAAIGAVREINSRNPGDNAWARIERGEITVDEFVALFTAEARSAGHALSAREVIDVVSALGVEAAAANQAMVDALLVCKERGLRLALITNNIAPLKHTTGTRWLFELFDVVLESCLVGRRKPEPAIYQLAMAALGTLPGHAVMLDDLGINLKPARALGMQTIKVTEPDVAARQLTALVRSLEAGCPQ